MAEGAHSRCDCFFTVFNSVDYTTPYHTVLCIVSSHVDQIGLTAVHESVTVPVMKKLGGREK